MPGVVDLSDLASEADGVAKIVLESIQDMLLKLALQMARDDDDTRRERQRQGVRIAKNEGKYPGRIPDTTPPSAHHRTTNHTIARTAELAGCSKSQVKRIWAQHVVADLRAETTMDKEPT